MTESKETLGRPRPRLPSPAHGSNGDRPGDPRLRRRLTGRGRLDAHEERHLEPLPVAVDVVETECAQPPELTLDVEQAVRQIFVLERLADRREERHVQAMGRRRDMFEVREHSAGFEQIDDLAVQRTLSLVLEMVDGH